MKSAIGLIAVALISLGIASPVNRRDTNTESGSAKKAATFNSWNANGKKAGLSGFVGIVDNCESGFNELADHIGWYSDYTATTSDAGDVRGIPMLWGDGKNCISETDAVQRLKDFKSNTTDYTPDIMFGFYEPDCDCPMSSYIANPEVGAQQWNELIAPLGDRGSILGSPSMCKQKDEDWLQPFLDAGAVEWDVTSIHINKNTLDGVKEDIEYYASTYGKPIWVSELACVDDEDGFNPCTDQGEINHFIYEVVPYLEACDDVVAYGPSNGMGLGDVWPLFNDEGYLSETGWAYLNALKSL